MDHDTFEFETLQRITRLETNVQSIAKTLDNLNRTLGNLSDQLSAHQRTPWGVLGTWAAVVVGLVGVVGGSVAAVILRDQGRIEADYKAFNQAFLSHVLSDGHPALANRVEALRERMQLRDEIIRLKAKAGEQ